MAFKPIIAPPSWISSNPGLIFPSMPPMPAPPVPPGGAGPEVFDLSVIDTPAEALSLPGTSLMTNLLIANSPNQSGRVVVESGGQRMEYEVRNGCGVQGNINGLPFVANLQNLPGAKYTWGNTSAGSFQDGTTYQAGVTNSKGKAGCMDYTQAFTVDSMSNFNGHIGVWNGTVGGKSFGMDLTLRGDCSGYDLSGFMGQQPVAGSIQKIDSNHYLVQKNVGGTIITESVELT